VEPANAEMTTITRTMFQFLLVLVVVGVMENLSARFANLSLEDMSVEVTPNRSCRLFLFISSDFDILAFFKVNL